MKPSSLSILFALCVTGLAAAASAADGDTTPAEAYYSSLLQRSSSQQQQQYNDEGIERSDRKSDYSQQQSIPPATSYSAIIVHNTPERLVKVSSDYASGKVYRTADSGIGDYHKSPREENIMSRDNDYGNHMSSDSVMHGVHPDIMQTLLNQQPQTFDNPALANAGYSDYLESDNSWTSKSAEQESDYHSDKNDKYSRKQLRKNRNYKKTYAANHDESKSHHQGNFGERDKPLALPSSRLQVQNARPDSIFNVGYSIGIHGSDPSMHSEGQPTKSGSNVHYEGRNTVWKELGSGVEMSVNNKRKPKHYIRNNEDKESERIVDSGESTGSLPSSSTYYYNDAAPDNTYNTNSNGFDHNHALRHSNSFDFSNAINPKTGLPYSVSSDEMNDHYVPKTELSAPIKQENGINPVAHESRINKQVGSIDKEDNRTPRVLTTSVNKYTAGSGNVVQGIPHATYLSAQKFSTNYNLIQPPFKSTGTIMYPLPLVLPKTTPLTSLPYIPPQADFTYQNLATLPNGLKTPPLPPPPPGTKPTSTVMAVLVPVNNGHMILPPLINSQLDLPYYGFYGNVIPPYAPNRFLAGPHALPPPAIKPEINLQNHQRNHPITVVDNQDFLLPKSLPLVRLDPSGPHGRKPVDISQDTTKHQHQDLVRYTRGNTNQRQRPLQALHYADELNLFPYAFNEKNKFSNFRPGSMNLEAQESGPYVFVSASQQRLSALNHNNLRDVLSPPPLYNQPPTLITRS